jgi:phenylacetate-CoA ligase
MKEWPMWNPEIETMPRRELEQLQLERLQVAVNRAYKNVPFYHRRFEELGIEPEDIQELGETRRLPFTTKADLRESYPYGMFAVPLREVVRIHASSGTTGMPTVVGYTRNDMANWSEMVARFLVAGGVTADDVVQISFGYGLFTGAFGLHQGAEKVGASVIPISAGNTERQVMIMRDFRTTALVGTPSYALHISEVMEQMEVDPNELVLRVGLFGSEPWSEAMRREVEKRLRVLATDNYGLSEILGPGVSGECEAKEGLHLAEDHFLTEVINPDTLEPVQPGQSGELVFTTLTKEAFPLLRYRTGDISSLNFEPCLCGRTLARMARVRGRTDDMLIVRGVNVWPSQIEAVLMDMGEVAPHYQIIVDREGALDDLEVQVEVSEHVLKDGIRHMVELERRLEHRLASTLGLSTHVKLVEPRTIERSGGKAKRVIDRRERLKNG